MKYAQIMALLPLATPIATGEDAVANTHDALVDVVVESLTISDAVITPRVIGEFALEPGRTSIGLLSLTAHDDAGSQVAYAFLPFVVTRFGAGPVLVFGAPPPTPIALTFLPPGPAWTARFVESPPGSGSLAIEVANVGSPGAAVRWKAVFSVLGTQVK